MCRNKLNFNDTTNFWVQWCVMWFDDKYNRDMYQAKREKKQWKLGKSIILLIREWCQRQVCNLCGKHVEISKNALNTLKWSFYWKDGALFLTYTPNSMPYGLILTIKFNKICNTSSIQMKMIISYYITANGTPPTTSQPITMIFNRCEKHERAPELWSLGCMILPSFIPNECDIWRCFRKRGPASLFEKLIYI